MEYRDLTPDEIPAAVDIFIDGVHELARRHNLPPPALDRQERIPEFEHTFKTGIFQGRRGWLVCRGGQPTAYAYEHHGWIGPAGWLEDDVGPDVLAFAAAQADGPVRLTAGALLITPCLASSLRKGVRARRKMEGQSPNIF